MTQNSLLVVGSVALDDLDGPFGRHPDVLGGSASYISVAASFLAERVQLVAVVGDDFPEAHVRFFAGRGIDLEGLERSPGMTFRWRGMYSETLESRHTLDTQLGVFADFRPRLTDAQRNAELLFLGNIHPSLQLEVLDQVRKPRLVACDTMNFWITGQLDELRRVLERVDILLVNDEEARQLAGVHNLVRAAEAIRMMGAKAVIVKRGDSGALLFHQDGIFAAPALPLADVRDPTGAGDSFAGGFMGALARSAALDAPAIRRAMIYGSVLASFCVEDFSLNRLQRLTRPEIAERFRAFHALTQFERIEL